MSKLKGGSHAVDNYCNNDSAVTAGAGEQLHDWLIHSYTAGYRYRCGVDQKYSGTKTIHVYDLI